MAVSSRAQAPRGLPAQLTSFVGRQRDLIELEHLIGAPEGRLVTLVGPGGVGKTRLALELAARLAATSPEIVFVELELLVDPDILLPTVAIALGVREQPPDALIDTLIAAILDRPGVLLLLDTCEHLVEACAVMVERLLRTCPDLRVLATSRERLDVPGEAVHHVTGLALAAEDATAQEIVCSEAGHLFLERARRLVPDLALEERGAVALARICRRLDGIPLAIEALYRRSPSARRWTPRRILRRAAWRGVAPRAAPGSRTQDAPARMRPSPPGATPRLPPTRRSPPEGRWEWPRPCSDRGPSPAATLRPPCSTAPRAPTGCARAPSRRRRPV
jgi:hypothetical protein